MAMSLKQLIPDVEVPASVDVLIEGLCLDSRKIYPGSAFIALRGEHVDGRQFIGQALACGAVTALVNADEKFSAGIHQSAGGWVLAIPSLPSRLSELAARFYGNPSAGMHVVAVTGTNGKTSCTQLLARAWQLRGIQAAVIGTLGNGDPQALQTATHTTPDAVALQDLLAQFREQGIDHLAMEASSHGLDQGRMSAVKVDVAVFTNLTRDHLDYHGTMDAYREAKRILMRMPTLSAVVLNGDDESSIRMQGDVKPGVMVVRYGLHADNDVRATSIHSSLSGLTVEMESRWGRGVLKSPLMGRFNVGNLLAVLSCLLLEGWSLSEALEVMPKLPAVPGRMQTLRREGRPLVVIDYAHTPDALEKVLENLRDHVSGQLWCVFGCGGNRDAGKRPLMGQVAAALADRVIVTTDNPRDEQPLSIVEDILAGAGAKGLTVELDRAAAIEAALSMASADDIVLIAGKGHEDYQEISGVRYPFNDFACAAQILDRGTSK